MLYRGYIGDYYGGLFKRDTTSLDESPSGAVISTAVSSLL